MICCSFPGVNSPIPYKELEVICVSIHSSVSSSPIPKGTEPNPKKRSGYSLTASTTSEMFFFSRRMLSSLLFAPARILFKAAISSSSSFNVPAFSGCGAVQNNTVLSTPAASILSNCIFTGNMICSWLSITIFRTSLTILVYWR